MKKLFVLILYAPDTHSTEKQSLLMLNSMIHEINTTKTYSVYNSTIHILSDQDHKNAIENTLESLNSSITFRWLGDSYSDIDIMNHHLNTHVQRAVVSTDASHFLVVDSSLPIFTHQMLSDAVDWEIDINIGMTSEQKSALILFHKLFTPFFFRISDTSIKTGDRSLILFQQYKRKVSTLDPKYFQKFDRNDETGYQSILTHLKTHNNPYNIELLRILSDKLDL